MICVIYQKVLKEKGMEKGNEKGNRDGTIRNNCGMPAKWKR